MALGNEIELNEGWTRLTDDSEDFTIQNIGNALVTLKYGTATEPATTNTDSGIKCERLGGIASVMFGQGIVWGRASSKCIVEVTK